MCIQIHFRMKTIIEEEVEKIGVVWVKTSHGLAPPSAIAAPLLSRVRQFCISRIR
jgi:hypothetical protein